MFDVSREDITEGSLPRALLVLAAPLVAQTLVQVLQQVVDVFWVGRLGEAPVAAVGLAAPLVGLVAVTSAVTYRGTQVVVSQRVGAGERETARRAVGNAVLAGAVLALAVATVGAALARPLVGLLDPGPTVAPLAAVYFVVVAYGFVLAAMSDALEGGFVGWGDARAALYINGTAVATNVVLDPLLILGYGPFPRLEVLGAALATGLGYGAGLLLALALALRGRRPFALGAGAFRPDAALVRSVAEVGSPAGGQRIGRQLARLVVVAIVSAAGGAAALAAYTVGARIASVAFVPAAGLGNAAASVVGQNVGAGNPDRAERATWLAVGIGTGGLALVGALQWLFPVELARLFVPGISGAGLALTVAYLRILAYGYPALGAIYTAEAGFNGSGHTGVAMRSTLLQYWGVRVPVAALGAFVLGYGALGPFWAVTLSNVAAAVGLVLYFRHRSGSGLLEGTFDSADGADGADGESDGESDDESETEREGEGDDRTSEGERATSETE
jgi:putative MATE family efflux protein